MQLPAGTEVTHLINLPLCGSWPGSVSYSIACYTNATIFYNLIAVSQTGPTNWYRRVGGTQAGSWQDWTLTAKKRIWFPMFNGENMAIIKYTSTDPISLCVETSRSGGALNHPYAVGIPYATPSYGTVYQAA